MRQDSDPKHHDLDWSSQRLDLNQTEMLLHDFKHVIHAGKLSSLDELK